MWKCVEDDLPNAPLHRVRIYGLAGGTGTGAPYVNGQVCSPMDFPDSQTLAALTGLVGAVAGVIGALATLIWSIRRKP